MTEAEVRAKIADEIAGMDIAGLVLKIQVTDANRSRFSNIDMAFAVHQAIVDMLRE